MILYLKFVTSKRVLAIINFWQVKLLRILRSFDKIVVVRITQTGDR